MHEQAVAAFQQIVDQYEVSLSKEIVVDPIVNKEYELGDIGIVNMYLWKPEPGTT